MAPDIGDRLGAVLRALEEVVIPGIDPANRPAIEQAKLCAMMVRIVQGQHDKAYHLAIAEVQQFAALLGQLRTAAGDALEPALAARIDAAVAADWASFRVPAQAGIEATARDYRELADAVVDAGDGIADRAVRDRIAAAVVAHSAGESMARRAWLAASGVEADPAALPTIDAVIASAIGPRPGESE